MRTNVLFASLIALSLLASGCNGNRSGRVRAEEVGSLDAPLASRARMETVRHAPCGSGVLTAAGRAIVSRAPYLQRVDSEAASVLLTIRRRAADDSSLSIAVSTPGGETIARVRVERDGKSAPFLAVPFRARIEGLSPATLYCYRLYRGDQPLTAAASLRTAPRPGDTSAR
ncbi:MAG: fibronectin type III domain-containing protein, partial [Polyangiaceae bacterium]|nr:fibronectin type III domain-containing protein [Polyangiaceae bacterium]